VASAKDLTGAEAVETISLKRPAVPLLVFPLILIIYLIFPTRNYYWDGVAFASAIEHAQGLDSSLIHPNHLFANVIGYLIYQVARATGSDMRAIHAFQIANSVFSVAAAYVLFRILRASLRSTYLVWTLTFLFSFSATWWRFSTDADAYIPSILVMLICFYLILPARKPRPLLLAIIFSASVCLHQLAVIFFPVLIVGVAWQSASRKERVTNALKFGGAAFAFTSAAYLLCFHWASGTVDPKRFIHWATSHSNDESVGFHPWKNLFFTWRGNWRLFFEGRFNLIKGLISPPIVLMFTALAVAALAMFGQFIVSARNLNFRWARTIFAEHARRRLLFLSVIWSVVYVLFLYAILAPQTFYRMFYLPALILAMGIVLDVHDLERTGARKYRLALFVATVALANFLFCIFPYSHVQKYKPLALALELNRTWPPGTVIYFSADNSDNALFSYFNPATDWKPLDSSDTRELEKNLRDLQSQGKAAWLDATAIDRLLSTPQGAEWLAGHEVSESSRQIDDPAYNIKFTRIVSSPR
jgi:hypothetical protein